MSGVLGRIADALSSDGKRSWLGTVVAFLLALVGVGLGAFLLWRNRSELARLRHAEAVRVIEARAADTAARVEANDAEVAAARERAEEARARADAAAADLKAAEDRYARDLRAIDRIRSWRDVDPDAR